MQKDPGETKEDLWRYGEIIVKYREIRERHSDVHSGQSREDRRRMTGETGRWDRKILEV
jgi:hypothetical protein